MDSIEVTLTSWGGLSKKWCKFSVKIGTSFTEVSVRLEEQEENHRESPRHKWGPIDHKAAYWRSSKKGQYGYQKTPPKITTEVKAEVITQIMRKMNIEFTR